MGCNKFSFVPKRTNLSDENFENLRKQYAAGVQTIRDFCDEAIDIKTFLKQTADHIQVTINNAY